LLREQLFRISLDPGWRQRLYDAPLHRPLAVPDAETDQDEDQGPVAKALHAGVVAWNGGDDVEDQRWFYVGVTCRVEPPLELLAMVDVPVLLARRLAGR
jgi:hypothetical protein